MVSVAKAWSRRPLASGLELGASGSAVQPLGLGTQGQGLPELEEVLTFSPFLSFLFFFFFFLVGLEFELGASSLQNRCSTI
jgi:hypothetical protein